MPPSEHAKNFNALIAPEITIIMDKEPSGLSDIVLRLRDGR